MKVAIWFIAAIVAYFISGLNISIALSKKVYKQDIRTQGSHNPGFTNFKRIYGYKYAWIVFLFDVSKSAITALLAKYAFIAVYGEEFVQIGIAFCTIFAMLGHAYPVQYGFKGGKGVLVCITMMIALDWQVGLFCFALLLILLLTAKYMSLSTMTAMTVGAILLFVAKNNVIACTMYACCVAYMIFRHKANIKRLISGTESKFSFATKTRLDKRAMAKSEAETERKEVSRIEVNQTEE